MSYQLGSIDPEERASYSGAPEPARRRSVTATALALGVMALFAGGVWFAYKAGTHHGGAGGVPLIRAEATPARIKPPSSDGTAVPVQNMLIYNEAQPKVERLLPPPEQPLPKPAPPPAAPANLAPGPPPASTPAAAAPAIVPPTAPAVPASAPATPSKPAAAPPAKPAAAAPAKLAPGGLRVQLGALRSPDLAAHEWARLKRANADILGSLSASPVRADLGDKGIFYRIEAGPLGSPEAAARLCGELKKRSIGCILVR